MKKNMKKNKLSIIIIVILIILGIIYIVNKYIYDTIVVRANADNTIAINNIENENGKSYLNISPGGWLDVTEEFKYSAVCIAVPNYRSLESNFLNIRVK